MQPFLSTELEQRGFVPIMWAHIGWTHFFTSRPSTPLTAAAFHIAPAAFERVVAATGR